MVYNQYCIKISECYPCSFRTVISFYSPGSLKFTEMWQQSKWVGGKRDHFLWLIALNTSLVTADSDLLLLKINTTLSPWCSGEYEHVGVRTCLFSLMLLSPCMTLGTELLFPNLWNGNRTTCLTSLTLLQYLQGSYVMSYIKMFFEIQIIIQNLGGYLSF